MPNLPKLGRGARIMVVGSGTPPLPLPPAYIQVAEASGNNLSPGTYEYAVLAKSGTKFSRMRGWVTITLTTSKNINISWASVSGVDGYRVAKRTSSNWTSIYYYDTTGTNLTDTGTGWTLWSGFGYNLALMREWTLDVTCDELDGSTFGTAWGTLLPGIKKWSATVDGFFNPTDNVILTDIMETPIIDLMLITHGLPTQSGSLIISPGTVEQYYDGGTATASLRFNVDRNGLVQVTATVTGQGSLLIKSI